MAIENYETYTKNILEMIFNNQDIEQLLPYLSKNIKAMGLNTESVLTYDDIINHLKQYKSNQFTFFIDEFNRCDVIRYNLPVFFRQFQLLKTFVCCIVIFQVITG